jgi:hypothetical protein
LCKIGGVKVVQVKSEANTRGSLLNIKNNGLKRGFAKVVDKVDKVDRAGFWGVNLIKFKTLFSVFGAVFCGG